MPRQKRGFTGRALGIAGLAMMLAGAAAPLQAGDAAAGLALAERWCNACHVLAGPEPRHADAGPPFAAMSGQSHAALVAAIRRPHDFMPPFLRLTDAEVDNLAAYIRSLD